MKIAVAGKGGVGKTTFSGTLARIFSERGYQVLAIDADPSMNLHTSLGLENPTPVFKLKDVIEERAVIAPGIFNLNPKVDDIPELYASKGENIKLLVMGTIEKGGEGCICPESSFLKALIRHVILKRKELLVLDTEAGVEHLGRKVAEGFDMMLVLTEPSVKAVETANRIYGLSKDIGIKRIYGIGNKTRDRDDEKFIAENLAFPLLGFIPYDKTVLVADREGRSLMDYPDSPAHMALEGISRKIEDKIRCP
jgi:CO dehydrogenase maturation factor